MKDNLDIEKLFQDKLGGLEADVSPDLWNNISQNIGSNVGAGAAAKTGMSLMLKKVLIGTGIVAAGITGVYLLTPGDKKIENETTLVAQNENTNESIEGDVLVENTNASDDLNHLHSQEAINELNVVSENNEENSENNSNQGMTVTNNTNNSEGQTTTNNESSSEETNQNTTSEVDNSSNSANDNQTNSSDNSSNADDTDNSSEDNIGAVNPTGKMEINASSFNVPSEVKFKANAKNETSIVWSFGDGESAQGNEVSHVYSQPGTYDVTLTILGDNELNYSETQKVEITTKSGIDNIPNVFTPDGDRINDLFSIKTTEINTFYMVIYNIKGQKVYETQDADFIWDGTDMGGNPVDKGIYTYMIKAEGNDGAIFSIPGEVQVR